MKVLQLPLALNARGSLERVDRVDAVISLLATMLATSETLWPGAPWFGLLETAQGMNMVLEDQDGLRDRCNDALERLGIDWARVRQIKLLNRASSDFERQLSVILDLEDGAPVVRSLNL